MEQARVLTESMHAAPPRNVTSSMRKLTWLCLLGAVILLAVQLVPGQPRRTAPGRAVGGSTQAPVFAPYEMMSVFPQESGTGEFEQVDPAQLQALSADGWQLVSVSPYAYRNEGHAATTDATVPPPPLVTQVYLAYFFQRSRMMH
ncbi:MAG TPA: hypothetical protein VGM43_07485 [Bryobacteraceae bacterium]|jgi:hypothetical protein